MTDTGPSYLTVDQAAARLGVHKTTLARYRATGQLPTYRVLGKPRFKADDVDRLLEPVPDSAARVAPVADGRGNDVRGRAVIHIRPRERADHEPDKPGGEQPESAPHATESSDPDWVEQRRIALRSTR